MDAHSFAVKVWFALVPLSQGAVPGKVRILATTGAGGGWNLAGRRGDWGKTVRLDLGMLRRAFASLSCCCGAKQSIHASDNPKIREAKLLQADIGCGSVLRRLHMRKPKLSFLLTWRWRLLAICCLSALGWAAVAQGPNGEENGVRDARGAGSQEEARTKYEFKTGG